VNWDLKSKIRLLTASDTSKFSIVTLFCLSPDWVYYATRIYNSILYIEGEKCMIFPKGKMSILSRSIYTIFFTVGSKNKKMMTNELSSFDEFNGISSCLDNTIRFLSQQSKKMKTRSGPAPGENFNSHSLFRAWGCFLCIQKLLLPRSASRRKRPFHTQKTLTSRT
jgi:hypothetical protein